MFVCRIGHPSRPSVSWGKCQCFFTYVSVISKRFGILRATYSVTIVFEIAGYIFFEGKGKDADSGTYYCSAKNKYGEARSREASLKIAMLRDDFRLRPRPVQVCF